MQHAVCVTWYGGTAQLSSLTELNSRVYFTFVLLAEPLTDEGGEETGEPRENPWRRASEKILQPEDSSPKRDSNPHNGIGSSLGSRRANRYSTTPLQLETVESDMSVLSKNTGNMT